jgi:hypothetical protein
MWFMLENLQSLSSTGVTVSGSSSIIYNLGLYSSVSVYTFCADVTGDITQVFMMLDYQNSSRIRVNINSIINLNFCQNYK